MTFFSQIFVGIAVFALAAAVRDAGVRIADALKENTK